MKIGHDSVEVLEAQHHRANTNGGKRMMGNA